MLPFQLNQHESSSDDSIIWRPKKDLLRAKHTVCYTVTCPTSTQAWETGPRLLRFAYDPSCAILRDHRRPVKEKIALIEATQSNRSRQHRCKRGRPFFLFLSLFFFSFLLKLQLVLLEKFVKLHQVAFWNSCLKRCGGRAHTSGFSDSLESLKRMTLVLLLALNSQRHCSFWRAEAEMEGRVGGGEMKTKERRDKSSCSVFSLPCWFHAIPEGMFYTKRLLTFSATLWVVTAIPAILRIWVTILCSSITMNDDISIKSLTLLNKRTEMGKF